MIKKFFKNKNKYSELNDYFVDKKQSKKFKQWSGKGYLFSMNIVVLSNNYTVSSFELNLDKFKNSKIIFKNSSFDTLKITEYNSENNNYVIFENCVIKNSKISMFGNSDIDINKCNLSDLYILEARNIKFNDIINKDEKKQININIVSNDINNIKIKNVNGNINVNTCGRNIYINNSSFKLNVENSNNVQIDKSNLFIKNIYSKDSLIITSTKLRHRFAETTSGFINTKLLNVGSVSEISNCIIKSDEMSVLNKSYLYIQNSYFDIITNLIVNSNSYCEDNNYKDSIIDAEKIYVYPNSGIDIKGLEYSNNTGICNEFDFNRLKQTRKKLIKVLTLVQDKYNPKLNELE